MVFCKIVCKSKIKYRVTKEIKDIPIKLGDCIFECEVPEAPSETQVVDWMMSSPTSLHLLATPIIINASHFVFDNRKDLLSIDLDPVNSTGVVFGTTILKTVLQNREDIFYRTGEDMYLELELFMGLTKKMQQDLALYRSIS